MQVLISPEAAAFVRANGGELWIWAARPRMCCAGTPALMHTAFSQPDGRTGFAVVEFADATTSAATTSDATASADVTTSAGAPSAGATSAATAGVRLNFRPLGGLSPDILEIGMQGRRRPKVQAYWDGCLMAMT